MPFRFLARGLRSGPHPKGAGAHAPACPNHFYWVRAALYAALQEVSAFLRQNRKWSKAMILSRSAADFFA